MCIRDRFLRYVVIENIGIILLHYTLDGGNGLEKDAVRRRIALNMTVRDPESGVCIREKWLFGRKLHLTLHISAVKQSNLSVNLGIGLIDLIEIVLPEFI